MIVAHDYFFVNANLIKQDKKNYPESTPSAALSFEMLM
jgi:hypothetical protein